MRRDGMESASAYRQDLREMLRQARAVSGGRSPVTTVLSWPVAVHWWHDLFTPVACLFMGFRRKRGRVIRGFSIAIGPLFLFFGCATGPRLSDEEKAIEREEGIR